MHLTAKLKTIVFVKLLKPRWLDLTQPPTKNPNPNPNPPPPHSNLFPPKSGLHDQSQPFIVICVCFVLPYQFLLVIFTFLFLSTPSTPTTTTLLLPLSHWGAVDQR